MTISKRLEGSTSIRPKFAQFKVADRSDKSVRKIQLRDKKAPAF